MPSPAPDGRALAGLPARTWLLLTLPALLLSAAAWLSLCARRAPDELAQGPGWSVHDTEQNLRPLVLDTTGLRLSPADLLRLTSPGEKSATLRTLTLELVPGTRQSSYLDLRLMGKGVEHRLYVVPGATLEAYAGFRRPGGEWQELAHETRARSGPGTAPLLLECSLDAGQLALRCDGQPLLALAHEPFAPPASAWLWTDDTGLARFLAEFRAPTGAWRSAQDYAGAFREELLHARLARGGLELVAALALAWAYLGARRAQALELRRHLLATLVLLAPLVLPLALAAWVVDLPGAVTGILCAGVLVPGVRLALAVLVTDPAPVGRREQVRMALTATLLIGAFVGAAAQHSGRATEAARAALETARSSVSPPGKPFRLGAPRTLDLGNALELAGVRRDLELVAQVTLEPGALLELRLRAPSNRNPAGVALFVGDIGRHGVGFVLVDNQRFEPLGTRTETVPVGRAFELRVRAREQLFTAEIDGHEVARARSAEFPAGACLLLAAAGRVHLESLELQGVAAQDELPVPLRARLVAALLALAAAGLLAFAAMRLLRQPFLLAAAGTAFLWLPAAWLLAGHGDGRPPAALTLALGAGASLLLLLMHAVLAPAGAWRGLLFVLLGLALQAPLASRFAPGPRAGRNQAAAQEFAGPRLTPGLIALEHPLLRCFNTWLRAHRLRERAFTLDKPAGTLRILCTGSSSTYGHGVPPESGLDYPTVLGELLRARHPERALEVLNGGVPGSSSARLYPFFREVLLAYQPDLVTLSLTFNDAHHLSVLDEGRYFERISDPTYVHDARRRAEGAALVRAGERKQAELAARFLREGGPATRLWAELEDDPAARPPPERFAENLRAFARVCAERGIPLVLIKEPVRDDGPLPWKEEFRAAIETVAAEFGLLVIDPTPALLAAGPGKSLFMDEVHPTPAGHAVLAQVLADALEALLAR